MVRFILEKGRDLKMSLKTLHNTIVIMDRFCERTGDFPKLEKGDPNVHELIAAACLLLGAKTNELDENIPFIPKLRKAAAMVDFTTEEVKDFEVIVGERLDWSLNQSSFYAFVEMFLTSGILSEMDAVQPDLLDLLQHANDPDKVVEMAVRWLANKEASREKVDWDKLQTWDSTLFKPKHEKENVKEIIKYRLLGNLDGKIREQIVKTFELYVRDLSNLVTRECMGYWKYSKSSVAAAIILYARSCLLEESSIWSSRLKRVCGKRIEDLRETFRMIESFILKVDGSISSKTTPKKKALVSTNSSIKKQPMSANKLEPCNVLRDSINTVHNAPSLTVVSNFMDAKSYSATKQPVHVKPRPRLYRQKPLKENSPSN